MKLSEIKSLSESAMSDKHQQLQDAIADEFNLDDNSPMIDKITAYLLDNEDDEEVDDFLYDHFMNDMPYGTQKARDGDPKNWIADHMASIFAKEMKGL